MSDDELLKDLPISLREYKERLRRIVREAYEKGVTDGRRDFLNIVTRTDIRVERVMTQARQTH